MQLVCNAIDKSSLYLARPFAAAVLVVSTATYFGGSRRGKELYLKNSLENIKVAVNISLLQIVAKENYFV